MAWLVLLASALFEAVWATALGMSDGFTRPGPTIVFVVALAISMAGLGWSLRAIPLGTAYAVWVGVGAALTVAYAMATGAEAFSWAKMAFLAGIIGAVVGLKVLPSRPTDHDRSDSAGSHRSGLADSTSSGSISSR